MSKHSSENDVNDYMDILLDAAKQRSSSSDIDRYRNTAECIQEIVSTLNKYKMTTTEEIIHILVSLMIIPIQMLEPDPHQRQKLMKELAIQFLENIALIAHRDHEIRSTENGKELDKLRNLLSDTKIFEK